MVTAQPHEGEGTLRALRFDCEGTALAGVLHDPPPMAEVRRLGVVVVVGGPQTRVGSHRQFTLLARALSGAGFPSLRFDLRGMGDSDGEFPGFEHLTADIQAAVGALDRTHPELDGIVLWGLCDAAAAIMLNAWRMPRVKGVVLLNPWVRTQATQAKTFVRHYYLQRLMNGDFWTGLFRGRVNVFKSLSEFGRNLLISRGSRRSPDDAGSPDDMSLPFPERMRLGMERFEGEVLLVLSGNDLTAAEFADLARDHEDWRALLERPAWSHRDLPEATHTFSSAAWRDRVATWTREWLDSR
ncbi:MAG: hydrolase 1, exosortase A system-associated [Pseudomonadota bacterium]